MSFDIKTGGSVQ